MAVGYGGLLAFGFELQGNHDLLFAGDVLELLRQQYVRGVVVCASRGALRLRPDAGNSDSNHESKCHDVGQFHVRIPLR